MRTRIQPAALFAAIIGASAAIAVTIPQTAVAQFDQLAVPQSPAFEEAASTLRNHPPRQYDFAKSSLSDVLRLMAEDAGISFFGLPDGATGADRLITFSINASPFSALETLAKANGISLIFDNGIWYLRPADDQELVGRIYEINYNSQELIRKNDQTVSLGGDSGGGEGSGIGLDLQGAPDFFVREPSRLLEDIKSILDLGTTGNRATFVPNASVDTISQLSLGALAAQPNLVVRNPTADLNTTEDGSPQSRAKVIWNSDSNTLYVVATRQQHQWIEGYLAAADRPQPMIAVQVQFIEINKDPRSEFGIDWSGTFQGGRGWGATLTEAQNAVNLDRIGDYTLPSSAILSYDDVNLRLRALFDDLDSKVHSFPRMVTMDNREVSFRSVVNQPVLASSSSASLGAGATESTSVEYIPIGTVINILPKKMANNEMLLNISITVSDIIGETIINGNPFPIATSRVYSAPVTVENGYSIAISGLDEAAHTEQRTGIPVLGRIPVLGYAFKTNQRQRSDQHLLMIITPRLLGLRDPGVNEDGVDYHPWSENVPHEQVHYEPAEEIHFHHDPGKDTTFAASQPTAPVMSPVVSTRSDDSKQRLRLHERLFGKKEESYQRESAYQREPSPEPVYSPTVSAPVVIAEAAPETMESPSEEMQESEAVALAEDNLVSEEVTIPTPPATIEEEGKASADSFVVVATEELQELEPATEVTTEAKEADASLDESTKADNSASPAPVLLPSNETKPVEPSWDGDQLSGGKEAVKAAVLYLDEAFSKIADVSPEEANVDQATRAEELYAHSERLLNFMKIEDESSNGSTETYSEDWWKLIELKARTRRISRSHFTTPTAIATTASGELNAE